MPDWTQFVRERLPLPPLSRNLEDSIIEDISIQLEDCYQDARSRGLSEEDAEKAALEHIEDWEMLASDIIGALEARSEEVMGFILFRGMKIVFIGLSAGVLIALGATTIMRHQVYGISTLDPITYIAVSIILGLTGLCACLIPAKRVVKVDPIQALRVE